MDIVRIYKTNKEQRGRTVGAPFYVTTEENDILNPQRPFKSSLQELRLFYALAAVVPGGDRSGRLTK